MEQRINTYKMLARKHLEKQLLGGLPERRRKGRGG
jgi:hypothetical protein